MSFLSLFKQLIKLAKRLKKEKVNVDVVNFGEEVRIIVWIDQPATSFVLLSQVPPPPKKKSNVAVISVLNHSFSPVILHICNFSERQHRQTDHIHKHHQRRRRKHVSVMRFAPLAGLNVALRPVDVRVSTITGISDTKTCQKCNENNNIENAIVSISLG